MAVTATPIFGQTLKNAYGQVTVANTARDGTGTLVTMFTAGANGSKVMETEVHATVTTTAGMVRIFISEDAGTTKRLYKEILVSAVTVGANTAGFNSNTAYDNFILPASAVVYASTHIGEAINVFMPYLDY